MATRTPSRQFADEILPDGAKRSLRVTLAHPDKVVTIHGRNVRVGDIPLSIFALECGHKGKGIAVTVGNTIFCDDCKELKKVHSARG